MNVRSAGFGAMLAGLAFILFGIVDGLSSLRGRWGGEWILVFGLGAIMFLVGLTIVMATKPERPNSSDEEMD